MIAVLDFINAGGRCITAAGWEFQICYIDKDIEYCICGYVISPNGTKNIHKWDKDGRPEKLPITHGLNLIPTVPITKYHMIDMKNMKEFDKVQDLVKSEIDRITNISG